MLAKLDDYEYKKSIMAVYDSVLYRSKRIQSHELFGFNIFLIGFMGVGKSTVSNATAEHLCDGCGGKWMK